ncbi:MAG: pyridoxamine 5'-phosphate oxidase [Woeseiaceae bacterium]|nr:pyridoxamine 5'-phosphate oxidase [Woeseiaceae bacterium]
MDVSDLRRSVEDRDLNREDLDDDPIAQFERWFGEACEHVPFEPNGVALCTVDSNGRPSSRTVLMKYFDESGFVFFTNYTSNKARDIEANNQVSMLFFWRELGRQLKINGRAEKIAATETLKYFATRPRGSQIGAWVSEQSSIVTSRTLLEAKFDEMKRKFSNKEVPLPSFWGGYRVVPEQIEFWQGRTNRLHDRFQYRRGDDDSWTIERLAP